MTIFEMPDVTRRPEPYEPGEELWNDPYIARRMLESHLSPDTDAASYRPEKIDAICSFLPEEMRVENGGSIVDLGCGPGLYCERLAAKGYLLTGIDGSENSINYARDHASSGKPRYVLGSYLEPFGEGEFDAAIMISQDFGVPSPEARRILLRNIHRALKPRGAFAFDVPSMSDFRKRMEKASAHWYASDAGFWRPGRNLVLEDTLFYPEISALCDRYFVIDSSGTKTYRVWQTFFSPESIRRELEGNGFSVEAIIANLAGEPYQDDSPVLGIVCRRS